VRLSDATDGFRLAYDRGGNGPPVLLLHGWPGERGDYRDVVPRLAGLDVIAVDLRGFGESDKHRLDPAAAYSAAAQARSIVALIEELGLQRVVIGGYDIGSRIGQRVAATRPDLLRGLVVAPPLPGIGARILDAAAQREFWYQAFHRRSGRQLPDHGRRDLVPGARWSRARNPARPACAPGEPRPALGPVPIHPVPIQLSSRWREGAGCGLDVRRPPWGSSTSWSSGQANSPPSR
jgi:pimeloyl-ACP methyl ester carboxylesterase